jgi:integrase
MNTRVGYHNGSLLREARERGPDVWVFRWREQTPEGPIRRKQIVGTVEQFPTRREAEVLRPGITPESWRPATVADLITHYTEKELPEKAGSTAAVYGSYIRTWVRPHWGPRRLFEVKTVAVEEWLRSLPLANGSKVKVRNVMHALFNHAMRHEWTGRNPITLVKQSGKRLREPDVLDTAEIKAILAELKNPYWTMVFLAASTGLRISELLGLKWQEVCVDALEIRPVRAIVDGVVGEMKTSASRKPIPMHAALAEVLIDWRGRCLYNQDGDWVFASPKMRGRQPYTPDVILGKQIRPAAIRAGIAKRIGWHTFRHSFATLLKGNGEDVKTVQESLRHANSRVTLDMYVQGLMPVKREAQGRVVKSLLDRPRPVDPRWTHARPVSRCRRVAQLVRALP